jgi:hypothetical protein
MVDLTDLTAMTHLLFAGIWTGSVVFVAVGVVPMADRDGVGRAVLKGLADRLTSVSRVSALLLLLTGGHLAAERYTVDSLTGSGNGHLVLSMIALWVILIGLVEVGAARIASEDASESGATFLWAAAVVAIALLLDAGLLLT